MQECKNVEMQEWLNGTESTRSTESTENTDILMRHFDNKFL